MQPTDAASRRLRRYSERSVEAFKTSLTIYPSGVVLKKTWQMYLSFGSGIERRQDFTL